MRSGYPQPLPPGTPTQMTEAGAQATPAKPRVDARAGRHGRMTGVVAAIDLGGTAMKGAVVREDGAVERSESRPTGREDGAGAVLERLAAFAGDLVAGAPARAVGIAVPGLVDEAAGVARNSVNLGWRDVPLRQRLEAR